MFDDRDAGEGEDDGLDPTGPRPSPSGSGSGSGSGDVLPAERSRERLRVVTELEVSRSVAWAQELRQVAGLVQDLAATVGPVSGGAHGAGGAQGDDVGVAEEAAAAELVVALRLSFGAARAVVEQALALTTVLPVTMAALEAGRLDPVRARVVVEETRALEDDQVRDLDARLAVELGATTPATGTPPDGAPCPLSAPRLRARVRHLVATSDPAAVRARARRATCERGVRLAPLPDGMAELVATGPALDLAVVHDRLTGVARARAGAHGRSDPHAATAAGLDPLALAEGSAGLVDRRRADARRFDALVDLAVTGVLPGTSAVTDAAGGGRAASGTGPAAAHEAGDDGPGRRPGPRATSPHGPQLVVALTSLVGLDDEPAQLAGQGPVPVEQARELLASGHRFRRALTDPFSGALVSLDGHLRVLEPPGPGHPTAPGDGPGGGPRPGPPGGVRPPGPSRPVVPASTAGRPGPSGSLRRRRPACPVAAAGGGTYTPTAGCERLVRARSRHCQAPGCRLPATRCDLDHRTPHVVGGPTCPCNLDVLCRRHHIAKHRRGWRATPTSPDARDPSLTWTSPLGQTAHVPAEPLLPTPGRPSPTPDPAARGVGPPTAPARALAAVEAVGAAYPVVDAAVGDSRRTRAAAARHRLESAAAGRAAAGSPREAALPPF